MLSFGYATEALLVLDLDLLVGEIPTARCVQVICLATCMLLSVFSITFAVLEFYYIELSSGMHHTSISRFANKTVASLSDGSDESSAMVCSRLSIARGVRPVVRAEEVDRRTFGRPGPRGITTVNPAELPTLLAWMSA